MRNLSEEGAAVTLKDKLTRFDANNISTFLLSLSGLDGKKVRKNAENELQDRSFRNLAHFVFVDEQVIIKKESPVHGTDSVLRTAESNVCKLLLSGNDDALLVATKKRAVIKAELQAQATLLDKLIEDYARQRVTQPLVLDHSRRADALVFIEHTIGKYAAIRAHFEAAIGEVVQVDILASEFLAHSAAFQNQLLAIVGQGKLIANVTLLAMTEDVTDPARRESQATVQVGGCSRLQREPVIEALHEAGQDGGACFEIAHVLQPKLLH